jgi:hypothetical protein
VHSEWSIYSCCNQEEELLILDQRIQKARAFTAEQMAAVKVQLAEQVQEFRMNGGVEAERRRLREEIEQSFAREVADERRR